MKCYLCNAFSESMKVDPNMKAIPFILSEDEFVDCIRSGKFVSCIGHRNLAKYLSEIAGCEIPYNRTSVMLDYEDVVIVATLRGRLPEHPDHVEYQGRISYRFMRFEKQNLSDFQKSLSILNSLIGVEA